MTDTLLLIDGSNFLFRAFHALPPLKSPDGRPTGAIRGVMNMFRRLMKEFDPRYVAVIFDASGPNFRNELYADYKAHRPPMPDDLRAQIEPLFEIIDYLGYPRFSISGVEADDVIATFALEGKKRGLNTIIASSDKDLAQIVDDGAIRMYDGMKDEMLDREGVFAKYGVYPELIRDYLSLMGDSADNVPGIPGVGPKTAVKWLNEWGSIDAIIENADQFKGKVGERLRENIEQLKLSRVLTTLKCDAPLPSSLEDLTPRAEDTDKLRQIYQEFGFRQLLIELDGDGASTFEPPVERTSSESVEVSGWIQADAPKELNYQRITTEEELLNYLKLVENAALLAIDTETDGLDFMQANLVGISLSALSGEAVYIPFKHEGLEKALTIEQAITLLKPLLEAKFPKKVGQNIKFDWHILKRHGLELKGISDDTLIASYLLDPTGRRHNMDALAAHFLNLETTPFEKIAGKGAKQKRFDEIEIEIAEHYAAEDADITGRLARAIVPQLAQYPELKRLYEEVEIPLTTLLAKMEHRGILVDATHLENLHQEFSEHLAELEAQAFEIAGESFNLNSPKQVGEILFEKLQLPIIKTTPKGQPSTNEAVLSELALDYPLPKLILEYREFAKLASTYTVALIDQINPESGRIHTSFNQALTSTGRLSSSEPNLQNIPIRTKEGRRIRQAFIAPEGAVLLSADYSQVELRLMAHFSEDETLLKAFADGLDIHAATASEVFMTPLEKVTSAERSAAKAINFGLIYGMGAFGLAKQIGVSRQTAQEYISLYFNRYPSVLSYMERAKEQARERGYAETLFGRRLYLPEIRSSNGMRRAGAERVAINAPLQGTAADIIKMAMLRVEEALRAEGLKSALLLQVHDELILEVPNDEVEQVKALLERAMTNIAPLKTDLLIEIGEGKNWDDAH